MAKRTSSDDVKIVVRNWGRIPVRVRRAIVDVARVYEPLEKDVCFPTPAGATWEDVRIELLTPEWVRISVKRVTRTYSFARIGLADRRRPGVPRAEWKMLRTYAENPEPDAYYRLPKRPGLKIDIWRFRHWLKKFFGIAGDPLKPFEPARWLPRFQIRDVQGE